MIEELPALDKGLTRAWQQMAIPEVGASLKDGVPNFPGPQIFFFLHPLFEATQEGQVAGLTGLGLGCQQHLTGHWKIL
jgi:hypothetical protein